MEYIETIQSPTKGIMRVIVKQRDSVTVDVTILDGKSAGYGFGIKMNSSGESYINRKFIRKEVERFIEQLGSSGYLDDGK